VTRLRLSLMGAALLLAACAAPATRPAPGMDPTREITEMMEASAQAWNRRDLDAFLTTYLDSPEITYVDTRGVIRGRAGIREMYASGWFAPGRDPGQLTFRDIEARVLGDGHALATGRFEVRIPGRDPATGIFTLVLRRTPEGWRIVHDHSS